MRQRDIPKSTLKGAIGAFLADLANANRSPHTLRAYASDLGQLAAFCSRSVNEIAVEDLRAFLGQHAHLSPATRSRKQAALASFFKWAYKQELVDANPMLRIDRIKLPPSIPRAILREEAETILDVIPMVQKRDRLLFRLILETGLRIGEALALYVEDINLTLDDERITVVGKASWRRTVLLDDPKLVSQLKRYLKRTGYQHGPLFRAQKNGRGGPLRYQSVQARWAKYCSKAGIRCTLHQLRHTHATELVNGGVSLLTVRKRLGHKSLRTTLRYVDLSNEVADREIRAWRRRRQHSQHP